MERRIKIRFHSSLHKFTKVAEHSLLSTSYRDALESCFNLFPKLRQKARRLQSYDTKEELVFISNNSLVPLENFLLPPDRELFLCPVFIGGGSTNAKIFAAVAIVTLIAINPGNIFFTPALTAGETAVLSSAAASSGVPGVASAASLTIVGQVSLSVALNLTLSALLPAGFPTGLLGGTGGARENNDAFGALSYTTNSNSSVPIQYGLIRVAGQLVSGYIKTVNHQQEDNVKVSDFVSAS